jgi:hypothetical protein
LLLKAVNLYSPEVVQSLLAIDLVRSVGIWFLILKDSHQLSIYNNETVKHLRRNYKSDLPRIVKLVLLSLMGW